MRQGPSNKLTDKSVSELFALHAAVMEELRERNILRSANNPSGDLAEFLFCKAFGWKLAQKVEKGFDAIGGDGKRYQIKGRRVHRRRKKWRRLGEFRDFKEFDVLAVILFDHDYSCQDAVLIPAKVACKFSERVKGNNRYVLLLRDEVWNDPCVEDVTTSLRKIESTQFSRRPEKNTDTR